MKSVLKYLGAVFFISLMLLKASAFHVYEHHITSDGEESQCELCVLTIDSQQAETLVADSYDQNENTTLPSYEPKIFTFDLEVIRGPLKTELFSRPPPTIL